MQINLAIQEHPHTEVTIIAHSLGGIVAFGYLAALVEGLGVIQTLPVDQNGNPLATIKAVVTLDSPLGGVTNIGVYGTVINFEAFLCNPNGIGPMIAVDQLKMLFKTAKNQTHRGSSASIVQAILGGGVVTYPYISNQQVADDAKGKSITVLTVGNTNDGLWIPLNVCKVAENFPSTQWLTDEGHSVYGRVFKSKSATCSDKSIDQIHKAVYNLNATEQAIEQILSGKAPNALQPAPK